MRRRRRRRKKRIVDFSFLFRSFSLLFFCLRRAKKKKTDGLPTQQRDKHPALGKILLFEKTDEILEPIPFSYPKKMMQRILMGKVLNSEDQQQQQFVEG
jgi:hypothetical protein